MRTTVDLPDELFRQAKAKAALSGLILKDLITRYVEQGLRDDDSLPPAQPHRRSPLPVIREATTGKPIPALDKTELAEIALAEDIAKTLHLIDGEGEVRELTEEDFTRARPAAEMLPEIIGPELTGQMLKRRGRPPEAVRKETINIRLSPEVLAYFRAQGRGWQTHIDEVLKEWIESRD